jgi:RimJ/RimL family protein N-acetyltransferase
VSDPGGAPADAEREEPRARRPVPTVRLAVPADDAALCRLFASVAMEGDLSLAVERTPEFFALYRIQGDPWRTYLAELEGRIEGLATLLARPGWLHGERRTVGYVGDLRLAPKARGGFFLGRAFGPFLREAFAALGCEVAYTAILSSNRAAIRALVERSRRFPDKPVYRPWRAYAITNLHLTRRRRPRACGVEVRTAREEDLPAVAALLARDHQARPFGYAFDEALLRQRLREWPGLTLDRFYLAERGGALVGVTAVWDPDPIKRFRVLAYRGGMRWIRRAFDVGAVLLRYPRLPRPGEVLRYGYLTHVSVVDEDPAVMGALLDRIYCDLRGSGLHLLTACLLEGDPLGPAYARYLTTPVGAQLFTVSLPGSPWNERDPGPGRPGLEMALV